MMAQRPIATIDRRGVYTTNFSDWVTYKVYSGKKNVNIHISEAFVRL
jgi:ribosomal protein S19